MKAGGSRGWRRCREPAPYTRGITLRTRSGSRHRRAAGAGCYATFLASAGTSLARNEGATALRVQGFDKGRGPVGLPPDAWPASQALAALRSSDAAFALVEDDGRPQSLVSEQDLERFGDTPLDRRLDELPALVCINASVGLLDIDDLVRLASLLMNGGAPGFVVLADEQVTGAVHNDDVAAALPLDAIGASRISGNPGVPTPWYICYKCQPSPSRRAPLDGAERPTCPRNWLHGAMTPEC
jgi:hypothetical protein